MRVNHETPNPLLYRRAHLDTVIIEQTSGQSTPLDDELCVVNP